MVRYIYIDCMVGSNIIVMTVKEMSYVRRCR